LAGNARPSASLSLGRSAANGQQVSENKQKWNFAE
jgi:hypothetical protein